MSKVMIVVGCCAEKNKFPTTADCMYQSERFICAKKIARQLSDHNDWYVLSAKYGLIKSDTFIQPYDLTIAALNSHEREMWDKKTYEDILRFSKQGMRIVYIGENCYLENIAHKLLMSGRQLFLPLKHTENANRIQWLNTFEDYVGSKKPLTRLNEILDHYIETHGLLWDFSGFNEQKTIPDDGVYIFYDKSSPRVSLEQVSKPRIARIGTHAVSIGSKASLKNRLRTHKGTLQGLGNHRSSVFRSHIGSALIANAEAICPTWENDSVSKDVLRNEEDLEYLVSKYLEETFSVLCIAVPGESNRFNDRAYLERNLIALCSAINHFSDIPESNWLGYRIGNIDIVKSGLWNVNHTHEFFDDKTFEILEVYLDHTVGKISSIKKPLSPNGWTAKRKTDPKQGTLFAVQ